MMYLFITSSQVVSNGICFSPSTTLLAPPIGVFQFYSDNFNAAAELCRVHKKSIEILTHIKFTISLSLSLLQSGDVTACHLLANLCVLQRYSLTDPACVQSMVLAGVGAGAAIAGSLPPIFYPSQSADEWLDRDDVNIRLNTGDGAQVQ